MMELHIVRGVNGWIVTTHGVDSDGEPYPINSVAMEVPGLVSILEEWARMSEAQAARITGNVTQLFQRGE